MECSMKKTKRNWFVRIVAYIIFWPALLLDRLAKELQKK